MKLAIIGAGSTYTPELVYGIIQDRFENVNNTGIDHMSLYDVDQSRLEITGNYCKALGNSYSSPVNIELSSEIKEALQGADFIVTQIRTGQNIQRAKDEAFIRDLGLIAQETTGAVGFLKAYRTVPPMIEIAKAIKKICPGAFLINFTNPAGIISTAIHRYTGKKNMAGLCNVPIFMRKKLEKLWQDKTGNPPGTLRLNWGGLNHLSWIFGIEADGQDVMKQFIDLVTSDDYDPIEYFPVNKEYVLHTKTIPSPYLRYFTDTQILFEEQQRKGIRAEDVLKIEKKLLEIYVNETEMLKGTKTGKLPPELSQRGGADYSRLAVTLINDLIRLSAGLTSSPKFNHILNVPDRESRFGHKDEFVETCVQISKKNSEEIDLIPLYPDESLIHPDVNQHIDTVRRYERLTVEAAVEQSPQKARKALNANPLSSNFEKVQKIIEYIKTGP